MGIRVGIPRGLLYYYYYPLWEKFFRALGVELVLSTPTSRPVFNRGVVLASDETCLPVKVFYGHVESLLDQQVDHLFLPRMVSMEKNTYLCPKLLGFPEVVTAMVSHLPPVLTADFNLRKDSKHVDNALKDLGHQLGCDSGTIKRAVVQARAAQSEFERLLQAGQEFKIAVKGRGIKLAERNSKLKIGVLGHAYLLYDEFTNININGKLNKMGAQVITPEEVAPEQIELELKSLVKPMFWSHSKRILGAGYSLVNNPDIDGVIHLTCFGCGPDSMVGDMVERSCRRTGKPFMIVTLDEHTGEAGVVTRLEAFIDMLKRRVEVENNISAYGQHLDSSEGVI